MTLVIRTCALICCAVCLLLSSCNDNSSSKSSNQTEPAHEPKLRIALVCSDLGLGDGAWVRECDAALSELGRRGELEYLRIGDLPQPQTVEGGAGDIGLPTESGITAGDMTLAEAVLILETAPSCDWLVLTSPLLAEPALERIAEGNLHASTVLVMDEQGWNGPPATPPVPVFRFRYDVRHVAFLTGVAAAGSSVNGHAVVVVADDDPQADEFFKAAQQGVKYGKNNAWVERVTLHVDPETGIVSGTDFKDSVIEMYDRAGSFFKPTDYIVAAGRVTPSVMYALTCDPWNGYVQGAYADYRAVRRARVIGCALKQPAAALTWALDQVAGGSELAGLADEGVIAVGLEQDAIGFTAFDSYKGYNMDGDDIENSVNDVWRLIKVDELGLDY